MDDALPTLAYIDYAHITITECFSLYPYVCVYAGTVIGVSVLVLLGVLGVTRLAKRRRDAASTTAAAPTSSAVVAAAAVDGAPVPESTADLVASPRSYSFSGGDDGTSTSSVGAGGSAAPPKGVGNTRRRLTATMLRVTTVGPTA